MLNFYNPHCSKCKKFANTFIKLADTFNSMNVSFSKMNAVKYEKKISPIWEINSYPSIYWVNKTNPNEIERILYNGDFNEKEISKFIHYKFQFHIERVDIFEDFIDKTKSLKNALLLIGEKAKKKIHSIISQTWQLTSEKLKRFSGPIV